MDEAVCLFIFFLIKSKNNISSNYPKFSKKWWFKRKEAFDYLKFILESKKINLGIYKKPVATGRASNNLRYSIVPGKPDESILLYRMQSLDPGIMMPESGRFLEHTEAVELINKWIKNL